MLSYFVKRLVSTIPVLFVISLLVFLFIKALPGDPARAYAGADAGIDAIEAARVHLGLHQNIFAQYANWILGVLKGDFGLAFRTQQPVSELISQAFWPTLYLAFVAFFWSLFAGLFAGIFAAIKKGGFLDLALMSGALAGISMPSFFLGLLLIQFIALPTGLFRVSGFTGFSDLILPSLTLGAGVAAVVARFTRTALLEVLGDDFIRAARAKGLKEGTVLLRHALKNALLSVITMLGLQFGFLLGGSIVVECVFSWPGLGWLLIESIKSQDQPVIQALVMIFVLEFLLINLFVDMLYAALNPKIRLGK